MHSKGNLQRGSAVSSLVVGGLIITAMILASIPGVARMQRDDARKACIENLALLESAKERFALDHQLSPGAPCTVDALIKDGKMLKAMPICVTGGKYTLGAIGQLPTCTVPGHVVPVPRKFVEPLNTPAPR